MEAAGAPAGNTTEGPNQPDDLTVIDVLNLHVEAAQRATAVACTAVILLLSLVDLLAQAVLDLILVVGLKANERLRNAGRGERERDITMEKSFPGSEWLDKAMAQ